MVALIYNILSVTLCICVEGLSVYSGPFKCLEPLLDIDFVITLLYTGEGSHVSNTQSSSLRLLVVDM
jgi:hypothetical protein